MEKIFKVWLKSWIWHSVLLKFGVVAKVFVKGPPFTLFRKYKMCFKFNFCAISKVGSLNNMGKYLKFERSPGFGTAVC